MTMAQLIGAGFLCFCIFRPHTCFPTRFSRRFLFLHSPSAKGSTILTLDFFFFPFRSRSQTCLLPPLRSLRRDLLFRVFFQFPPHSPVFSLLPPFDPVSLPITLISSPYGDQILDFPAVWDMSRGVPDILCYLRPPFILTTRFLDFSPSVYAPIPFQSEDAV